MKASIFFILLLATIIQAQSLSDDQQKNSFLERESPKYQNSFEKYMKSRSFMRTVTPQILETTLDENEYIIGPGDVFAVNIYGEFENSIELAVNPDGFISIPTVGQLKVNDLTLKETKRQIIASLRKMYIKTQMSVNLASLRKFRVYLAGAVFTPGTYFVQATERVSDIIELSGGFKEWANNTRIEIKHLSGKIDTINITDYYLNANLEANPTLQGGDIIRVPVLDLQESYISVLTRSIISKKINLYVNEIADNKSSIKYYPFIHHERVSHFFERISAFSSDIDLSRIIIVRNEKRIEVNLLNEEADFNEMQLKNKDQIIIPEYNSLVYVQGEVRIPGGYPFNVNWTANDYVGRAGVLERAKDSEEIRVIRKRDGQVLKGGSVIVEQGDTIIVPRKSREAIRDYIYIIAPVVSMVISSFSFYLTLKAN